MPAVPSPSLSSTSALHALAELNTRLWTNCLRDVGEDLAWRRPTPRTNSLGFLALHLLDARYFLAAYLGLDAANPYQQLLDGIRSIQELPPDACVPLDAQRQRWQEVSRTLLEGLADVDEAKLAAPSPTSFPVADPTRLGGVLFLLHHEAYHIGQLGLLRKYWGLPPMRYDADAEESQL